MDHPRPTDPTDTGQWIPDGIASGIVGAAVIAVFFLIVDIAYDRAFWTPAALGSALFTGEPLATGDTPQPALVTGYTVLHGGVFVSVGLIGAYALFGSRLRRGLATGAVLAAALFAGIELVFLVFAGLLATSVAAQLTGWRIAAANLLAAAAMSATLVRSPAGGWGSAVVERLRRAPHRPPDQDPRPSTRP